MIKNKAVPAKSKRFANIGVKVGHGISKSIIDKQTNKDWSEDGVGLSPQIAAGNRHKEGVGEGPEDRLRYEKGYSRMMGACDKCEHYKGKNAKQGYHCRLRRCDR